MTERLGIDIGSKTLKLMLIDEKGNEVFSSYQKHKSKIGECLQESIHAVVWRIGDRDVRITVTGSSGMRISELFDIPFVQEVVALKRAVLESYPNADAVLEMGGEDTKLVYLTGAPEQRMNNICAGGTGSFIEMMGGLMGTRTASIGRLAMGYSTIYPIASRCAVFAKSDVRPLINAGARKEDIAASVLDAVCTQAIAGLSAGRPLTGTVLLLGGPFQHINALRDAFCRVSGFDRKHAIVPKDAHLFVARGAALSNRATDPMRLSDFEHMLAQTDFENDSGIDRLKPLFGSEEEIAEFRERHRKDRVPRVSMLNAGNDLFLGIDAGSTTAKIALIDAHGALVAYDYHRHRGDVIECLSKMLKNMMPDLRPQYLERRIVRRSCVVGYGEQLCRTAFGIDDGEVETVAHLRAARAIDPDVDFLLDIGGQDVKCFYVQDGMIQDVVLNEACSSGCGSLFDSVAKTFNRTRADFVSDAMHAQAPVDLGTRCTTFMNSRIRHAQKEGASKEDIAAGVCYATVRNALFKVVRQPDFSKVGKHIIVQGGAFGNDALLRAFELETGVEVKRPDLAPIMGAWGAALLARDAWLTQKRDDPAAAQQAESGLIDLEDATDLDVRKRVVRCNGCTNNCELRVTRFAVRESDIEKRVQGSTIVPGTERILVTGNRCERGALMNGASAEKVVPPPNMVKYKRSLISAYKSIAADGEAIAANYQGVRVGIPKSLSLYESYPFWVTMFKSLGVKLVDGIEPSDAVFKKGMACIPAEGMCHPAKMIYGQAVDLVKKGAEIVFVPSVGTAFSRVGLAGYPCETDLMTCPLVEKMGDMLAGNAEGSPLSKARIAAPDLRLAKSLEDICVPIVEALGQAGLHIEREDAASAIRDASCEYRGFLEKLASRSNEIVKSIDEGEYPGIVLVGHAYHAAEGLSHGVDELLGELGYAVLERIDSRIEARGSRLCDIGKAREEESRWYENVDALQRIAECKSHPHIQPIIIRSFGCGIDALVADELRDRLREAGSIYTELKMDQIADLATVRIRLRSLAYAHKQREGEAGIFELTVPSEAYEDPMAKRLREKVANNEAKCDKANRPDEENAQTGNADAGSYTWETWMAEQNTETNCIFDNTVHVSILAPTGYIIEFDADVLGEPPKPGVGGLHIGPKVSANGGENARPKPRRTPYAHKYLGLRSVAGHTLKPGFSRAINPLDPGFSFCYQGLAYVDNVPVPVDIVPPGRPTA